MFALALLLVACGGEDVEPSRPSMTAQDFGDDRHLDALWVSCASDNQGACDELLELAPPLSEYRAFALEMGGQNAGRS
jgi:hypothetical protein